MPKLPRLSQCLSSLCISSQGFIYFFGTPWVWFRVLFRLIAQRKKKCDHPIPLTVGFWMIKWSCTFVFDYQGDGCPKLPGPLLKIPRWSVLCNCLCWDPAGISSAVCLAQRWFQQKREKRLCDFGYPAAGDSLCHCNWWRITKNVSRFSHFLCRLPWADSPLWYFPTKDSLSWGLTSFWSSHCPPPSHFSLLV